MKMLKKNVDHRGCTLVTAYNAALFAGLEVPYEDVLLTARACCGFNWRGLDDSKMSTLFNNLNIPAKRQRRGTPFHRVLCALYDGHAVALAYQEVGQVSGHAILVTPQFEIVNPESKYRKWKDLFVAICEGEVTYNAWIVGKNNDVTG